MHPQTSFPKHYRPRISCEGIRHDHAMQGHLNPLVWPLISQPGISNIFDRKLLSQSYVDNSLFTRDIACRTIRTSAYKGSGVLRGHFHMRRYKQIQAQRFVVPTRGRDYTIQRTNCLLGVEIAVKRNRCFRRFFGSFAPLRSGLPKLLNRRFFPQLDLCEVQARFRF
jgi:hypothetical protein